MLVRAYYTENVAAKGEGAVLGSSLQSSFDESGRSSNSFGDQSSEVISNNLDSTTRLAVPVAPGSGGLFGETEVDAVFVNNAEGELTASRERGEGDSMSVIAVVVAVALSVLVVTLAAKRRKKTGNQPPPSSPSML